MTGVRNTGFVVSLALLASLVGHVAVQRHFERRAQSNIDRVRAERSSRPFDLSFEASDIEGLEMPQFLDEARRQGQIIPALASRDDSSQDKADPHNNPPKSVPAPTDAVPVDASRSDEAISEGPDTSAVRDVIEHELSHASREEREIWFEELKSLPAGVVSDLLQVRKQLHALPKLLGGMTEKLASADPGLSVRTQEIQAEPASQKIRFHLPDNQGATASLEMAVAQMRHNLTNAATPGFKRFRVTLVDSYGPTWSEPRETDATRSDAFTSANNHGDGCRIAPLLLDLKQGPLKKTGRQLDLAIDGEGFFVVQRNEKEFLTRCGALTLDRDRRLCLLVTNDKAVLQPVISIPDDAREVQVSADGVVTILKSGETTLTVIGQLQLARVASPSRLQPAGSTLFIANDDSGSIVVGSPMAGGLGELQQGFLEQSNVDFVQELAEIEELSMILSALPLQTSRPATARSLQHVPTR